ncbi:MAG: hypothetical protein Q8Q31_04100 [Nanoarchaeota archaeon]|nr:hypothetical protein [Nanoarchaeota archaeon]
MKIKFEDLSYIADAHQFHPKNDKKAFRKWDGRTPYFIHPLWCATTILTETRLDEKTRVEGYYTLLYHDLLEDTTQSLPASLEKRIEELVKDMTFLGGSEQEMNEIWSKLEEIRLYKLYDKVSNLLDGTWMSGEKRRAYGEYVSRLCLDVEQNYGALNITLMARAIISFPFEHDAMKRLEAKTNTMGGENGLYQRKI